MFSVALSVIEVLESIQASYSCDVDGEMGIR
jgi:hypothetical protein